MASIWSMSRSSPATTGAYPSTTWSKIAHSADELPAASSSGRCSSRCLRPAQLARHALPHRDHEGRREEDADLAELDFLGGVVVTRGAQDHQPHVSVVALDLRPHMKVLGVLHRQLMQAEGVPDLGQLLFLGLEQSQPHEAALPASGRSLLQRHRALIAPATILVVSTINDHLGDPLVGSRGRHPLPSMAE